MKGYLARFIGEQGERTKTFEKASSGELTKLTKPSSVSFVSPTGKTFSYFQVVNEKVAQPPVPPFLTPDGGLRIPCNTFQKYRWWADGQSIWKTLAELNAPIETWRSYAGIDPELLTDQHMSRCGGEPFRGEGFAYCAKCGRFMEGSEVVEAGKCGT